MSFDTLAGATLSGRIGIYQGGGNCNEWSKDITGEIQPDGSFNFMLDESLLGDCMLVSGSESFSGATDGRNEVGDRVQVLAQTIHQAHPNPISSIGLGSPEGIASQLKTAVV